MECILAVLSESGGRMREAKFEGEIVVAGEPIELSHKQANDIHDQVQSITWRFEYREIMHETSMRVRWIYREEFKLLLRLAGFVKWDLYGDFDKSEFNSDSSEMIWFAKK
jgi:hypothetical protein